MDDRGGSVLGGPRLKGLEGLKVEAEALSLTRRAQEATKCLSGSIGASSGLLQSSRRSSGTRSATRRDARRGEAPRKRSRTIGSSADPGSPSPPTSRRLPEHPPAFWRQTVVVGVSQAVALAGFRDESRGLDVARVEVRARGRDAETLTCTFRHV